MIFNSRVQRISTTYVSRPKRKVLIVQGHATVHDIGPNKAHLNTKYLLEYKNSVNGTLTFSNTKISCEIDQELHDQVALGLKKEIMQHVREYLMNDYRKMIYNFIDKRAVK